MKTIGILKAYDRGANDAKFLVEYLGDERMDELERLSILKYLREGKLFVGLMEWWFDFEDSGGNYSENEYVESEANNVEEDSAKSIGGAGYYTDGKWIWAAYLPYYLEKYANFKIDEEFLIQLENQNYKMPYVSEEQKKEALNYFNAHVFKGIHCEPRG